MSEYEGGRKMKKLIDIKPILIATPEKECEYSDLTPAIPMNIGTLFTVDICNFNVLLKLLDMFNVEIYKKNEDELCIKVLEKKNVYDDMPVFTRFE